MDIGTRTRNVSNTRNPPGGSQTRSLSTDPGMSKLATSTATFTTDGKMTGSDGDFAAFAVNDRLLIEGANLNNGYFVVDGVDATNQAYLVLVPNPKDEGPLTVTVRTS